MDRIQKPDTAYQDNSQIPLAQPRFTVGTTRKARQVVALRPDFIAPIRGVWESLCTGIHRARLLAGIILVGIAGGVAGWLIAMAGANHELGIDTASVTVGAAARFQADRSQPFSRSKETELRAQPADSEPALEFEGPEIERAIVHLRKRRPPSRTSKAYLVATIYPRHYDHSRRERRRGRKH